MPSLGSTLVRNVAVAVVAAVLTTVAPATAAQAAHAPTAREIRDRLEYRVNRARARHDLPRLRVHSTLEYYARDHADDMADRTALYHDSRLRFELPSGADAWGENVGATASHTPARRLHYLFMHSSAHRANILRRDWTHMGIGIVKRGGYVYVTQRFMRR